MNLFAFSSPIAFLFVLIVFLFPMPGRAEMELAFFLGDSRASASDVDFSWKEGGQTTLGGVEWTTESFREPPFWGMRALFWLPRLREAGFGLEYTHAKIFSSDSQILEVSGPRYSSGIRRWEPLSQTIRGMAFSHGLNLFILQMQRRWNVNDLLKLYTGLGIGVSIPHVEGKLGDFNTDRYRYGGFAYEFLVGASFGIASKVSLLGEYRMHFVPLKVLFDDESEARSRIFLRQLVGGVSILF